VTAPGAGQPPEPHAGQRPEPGAGQPPEPHAGQYRADRAGGSGHVITLLTRPGCHLCDEARAVIARVAADLGVAWQERDITRSQSDLRAYSDQVPVTLIDGRQHDFWRVSEQRLRAALAAPGSAGAPVTPGAQAIKDQAKRHP
jgi:glutaredoxin